MTKGAEGGKERSHEDLLRTSKTTPTHANQIAGSETLSAENLDSETYPASSPSCPSDHERLLRLEDGQLPLSSLLQHHTDGVDERLEDRVDGQYQNDQGRIGVSGKLDPVEGQKAHQVHWKPAQEVPDGDRNQALGNGPIGGFQHASRRPKGFSF